ncbi:MAG: NADH-quinone oxidoreductase subunit M [Acidimicrobiia bacterium]|nr:NADH-quinone oxidoreductase subunit M [Acidimicrobiia bacterium]
MPILTILIAAPIMGAVVVALLPSRREELVLPVALGASIVPLAIGGYLVYAFGVGDPSFQFAESFEISSAFGISWQLAIDGVSLFMVALTVVLFPLSIAASRSITYRAKTYMALMLVLEGALIGVFVALDLLVFFAFFEIVLIPMYLLISIWGSDNRAYASIKFVLFTATGSAFLLAGIVALGILAGDSVGTFSSFDMRTILGGELSDTTQLWLFLAFGIAFAIKVPLFPFHTWLPDAHTEAPTAGSVILAGVLLKMGTYGLLRFNLTLFPDAAVELAPIVAILGVVGIIYGAAAAIVQPDIKRLVAYSSVSHMGFIILGTFAFTSQALQGSVFQMISHGLTTGALFLLIGMIYDRTHTRLIADYGGLSKQMPVYGGIFLFAVFASAGLPGLSGFVGEFTILIGSYLTLPVLAIIAGFGVILAAIYLLWAYERMWMGPPNPKHDGLRDLGFREVMIMVPLIVLVIGLGVYPKPVMDRIQPSVDLILDRVAAVTDFEPPTFGDGPADPGSDHGVTTTDAGEHGTGNDGGEG